MLRIPESSSSSGQSNSNLACKDLPPPLYHNDYPDIRFWTSKSYDEYCRSLVGETNGLSTKLKKRGCPAKSDEDDKELRYPYLETESGAPINRETLIKVGQKARRLWQALKSAGLASQSWIQKSSEIVYSYFMGKMLNEPGFQFFRYNEGNWKLNRWATKVYASWKRNHLKVDNANERNEWTPKEKSVKCKRDMLDDPNLLQIGSDRDSDSIVKGGDNAVLPDHYGSPSISTDLTILRGSEVRLKFILYTCHLLGSTLGHWCYHC